MSFDQELLPELKKQFPVLTPTQTQAIAQFGKLLYLENQKQNLTRIEGVQDFIDGHLIDVLELYKLGHLGESVADIGSGSGVPGLLAAAIDTQTMRQWHLIESELHKAEYLAETASELNLSQVKVHAERAEKILSKIGPQTVMARAVGNVEKIAGWIWECSTWNNLILFKSRGWTEEWKAAQKTRFGKKLTVTQTHEYSIQDKYRVLVKLTRS